MVLKINKNKLQNLIEDTYRNYLFNIEKIIDYTPPKYDPNWNKKFKQVYRIVIKANAKTR